ncbi:hypothetical protein DFH07DRAFT_1025997 [Mycena maculata]|uniref:Uncharacterized protein n=1 Tax=Mycena maculata TaxID=230809 RepID=A0AAD7NXQ5_9AGAR|nr:hypothetical protein DFH07DRAFT_1025997 [Mycena maculata]
MFKIRDVPISRGAFSAMGGICLELTADLTPILASFRNRTSSLRRSWLQWSNEEGEAAEPIDCFETTTSLLEVGVSYRHHYTPVPFPEHQLTWYNLEASWEVHQGILKLAQNLVNAHTFIGDNEAETQVWPDPMEAIDLLHFRCLFVSDIGVLNYIRVGALEEMAVYVEQDYDLSALLPLDSFIARSSTNLRSLCVEGKPTTHMLTELLQRFPGTITDLAISIDDPDEHSRLSCHPTRNATISPQLSRILFGCEAKSQFDYHLYLEMLRSRLKAESCALRVAMLVTAGWSPSSELDVLVTGEADAADVLAHWTFRPLWI